MPLSRKAPKWVPTSEVRGEGVFLQFSEQAIEAWVKKTREREAEFFEAHRRWRKNRGLEPDDGFPTMRYVLAALAGPCPDPAVRPRVRLHHGEHPGADLLPAAGGDHEPMAGILLYTAAPDSEGTLGGLVALGEPKTLGRHLDQALEAMRLCASDPLCAEHHPIKDGLTLHGAACHACLFLPETSCERGNKYLDRSVLVSTVETDGLAFFTDFAEPFPRRRSPPRPTRRSRRRSRWRWVSPKAMSWESDDGERAFPGRWASGHAGEEFAGGSRRSRCGSTGRGRFSGSENAERANSAGDSGCPSAQSGRRLLPGVEDARSRSDSFVGRHRAAHRFIGE